MFKLTILTIMVVLSCGSAAGAYTVTFDDVAPGTNPQVYLLTDTPFYASYGFVIQDHSATTWGPPHSPNNVLEYQNGSGDLMLLAGPLDANGKGTPIDASFFGAYFSTPAKNELTMTLYKRVDGGISPLTSLTIGSRNEVWSNHFVGYNSPAGDIFYIKFQVTYWDPLRDPRTLALFSMDDVTVTPVPEPSSLAALVCGLAGVGGVLVRRRRL